jgi:hypothetical protein
MYGTATERTDICEQSFNACKGQEYTAETAPAFLFVPYQVIECVERIESF